MQNDNCYWMVNVIPVFVIKVLPGEQVTFFDVTFAVTVTVWPFLISTLAALTAGVIEAGLTTPVEKSAVLELSQVAGAFQLPDEMVRK